VNGKGNRGDEQGDEDWQPAPKQYAEKADQKAMHAL
jgi:hypothetical protein